MGKIRILQDSSINDNEGLLLSHSVTLEIDPVSLLKEYVEDPDNWN